MKKLIAIIERSSKYYIQKHADTYVEKLNNIVRDWRQWVREQLSVRRGNKKFNGTLYPYMRKGNLRNSLTTRKMQSFGLKKASGRRYQMRLHVPVYWKKLKGFATDDYGEELNSGSKFSNSSFFGWKDRVHEELDKRIKARL